MLRPRGPDFPPRTIKKVGKDMQNIIIFFLDLFDERIGARDAEEKGVCVALGKGGETVVYH